MLLQRIQGRDDLLPQHVQALMVQRERGDGAGKAGAKKPDIPSVLNKTSHHCWYPNTCGPWISRFHTSFCQPLSLTHPWRFPPLPLPSCWGLHSSRAGGRLSMETLIHKVSRAGGLRREEGAVGEGASPEVNADSGGAVWPGLCNGTHPRTCSTYLWLPGINNGSLSPRLCEIFCVSICVFNHSHNWTCFLNACF